MKKNFLLLLFVTVSIQQAWAGDIQGTVKDENNDPLEKVLVCLHLNQDRSSCYKTRATNKNGNYAFKGLKTNQKYTVTISSGTSLAARKSNPYPNKVWLPAELHIDLTSQNKSVGDQNFQGIFNFSNFQQELQLTSAEFPQLADYDTSNDWVFLKLYSLDQNANENLIFLGQVTNAQTLQIDVSVPQAATELYYEIYSLDRPERVQGTISLTNG